MPEATLPAPFDEMDLVPNLEKTKEQPEFRILISPPEALIGTTTENTVLIDTMKNLVKRDQGDNNRQNGADSPDNNITPRALTKLRTCPNKAIRELLTEADGAKYALTNRRLVGVIGESGKGWSSQPEFDDIFGLRYISLGVMVREGASVSASPDSQGDSQISGFTLIPSVEPYNCVYDVPAASLATWRVAQGDAALPQLKWRVKKPTSTPAGALEGSELYTNKGFEAVQFYGEKSTGLQFARMLPDATAETETETSLAPNQQFSFIIEWLGKAAGQTTVAGWRLSWGNDTYSLLWREGHLPSVEKKEGGVWQNWRTLEGAPTVDFTRAGAIPVQVTRILGKMVVKIEDKEWCIADARKAAVASGEVRWQLQECTWPKGKVRITSFGALFELRQFSRLMYRRPGAPANARERQLKDFHYTAEGKYWKYSFGFYAKTRKQLIPYDEGLTVEYQRAGWHTKTAWIKIADSVELGEVLNGFAHEIYYIPVLRAGKDAIDAPFLSELVMEIGLPQVDTTATPIDVGPCMITADETTSEPAVTTCADWNISLSPHLLDLEFGTDAEGNGLWQRYVRRWNMIEFAVRWRYTDGTYSLWTTRLRGHIVALDVSADAGAKWSLSMQCQDPILRMSGNAGLIDHRFAPLDFYMAQKNGEGFYGAEAAYYILRNAMGTVEANKLNGNTTGQKPDLSTLLRYFPEFHYPLLGPPSDAGGYLALQWATTGAPSTNGAVFMPPWGSSSLQWLTQVACTPDFALFYYGFAGGYNFEVEGANSDGDGVVPIYGHYYTLMRDRPTWRVADAYYIEGDLNVLLKNASWSDLPEWQINEVLIWNTPPGSGGNNLPYPAVIQGAARLDARFEGSAAYSWRRQLIDTQPMIMDQGVADGLAQQTLLLFQNEHIRRVRMAFIGEERMCWGDKLVAQMVNYQDGDFSPKFLNLSGEIFRIIRLGNRYSDEAPGCDGFITTASCAPYNENME